VGLSAFFLIVCALLWQFQLSLTKLYRIRQLEGEAAVATLISAPQLRQELSLVRETVHRIEKNLASDDNLDASLTYFYAMEGSANVRLEELNPLTTIISNYSATYRRIPFSLKISGSYSQVVAFLRAIETGPKPACITYLSFRRRTPDASLIVLDLNVDLLGKERN
jgi:Tfp pilus assembly protein PilO